MDKTYLKLSLLLTLIEGILAEVFLFWIPSEKENALFWGFSISRLLVGASVFTFLLLLGYLTFLAWLQNDWLEKCCLWLDEKLSPGNRLLYLCVTLTFLFVTGLALCLLFYSPLAQNMHHMTPVFFRFQSIFIWGLGIFIQSVILLRLTYAQIFRQKDFYNPVKIIHTLLILLVISCTAFYWAILVFQDALFVAIEGWFWQFHAKSFSLNDLIFVVIAAFAFACVGYILRHPHFPRRNLALLVALGFILQAGFGFIEGQGFESIRVEYVKSFHKSFAEHASDNPDPLNLMINYEQIYGPDINLGTKPPGALLFYIGAQKISNLINPETTFPGRVERLTSFMAYVFPLLAVLVILPLYSFSRQFLNAEDAILPCLLYIFCTNFILMPLSIDQFLFPLLFVSGLLLCLKAIRMQSFTWAVLAGAFIYLSIFFTFSLLPLIPAAFLWIIVDYVLNRKERRLVQTLKIMFGLALGIVAIYFIFRILLNYDIFLRYQNAFTQHRTHKEFKSDFEHLVTATVINNFEFAFWTGVPIILLSISRFVKAVIAFFRRSAGALDGFSITLLVTYAGLNVFGQTRSETGRLWLFVVPFLALFAAVEMRSLFKSRVTGFFLVVGLLLVSAFLTFQFQDFYF